MITQARNNMRGKFHLQLSHYILYYYRIPNIGKDAVYLFNLAEDPNETTNLATNPQYADILEIMMERLQVNTFFVQNNMRF